MNISDIQKCNGEYEKFLEESPTEGIIRKISRDILEQKNNAMAMEFTRIICDLLKENGIHVRCKETELSKRITHNSIEERHGIVFEGIDFSQHDKEFKDEIEKLKKELNIKQEAIDEIDNIICELFGVAHNGDTYSDDFKEILRKKSATRKTITDFLPTEPIKVADMLINAEGEYEHNPITKALCGTDKGTYRIFEVSELRQIAQHLMIYCESDEKKIKLSKENTEKTQKHNCGVWCRGCKNFIDVVLDNKYQTHCKLNYKCEFREEENL